MYALLSGSPYSGPVLHPLSADGEPDGPPVRVEPARLPDLIREHEARGTEAPRWVWADTAQWYPELLRRGVRIARVRDLRLGHALLALSPAIPAGAFPVPTGAEGAQWQRADPPPPGEDPADSATLFDEVERGGEIAAESALAEFRRQLAALDAAARVDPVAAGKLRLLVSAESGGALIAAEIHHRGLPWSAAEHDRILTEALGPRPRFGGRPPRMEEDAARIREALGTPGLNPDSPQDVLRALQNAGLSVASTSKWELREIEHPVIEPLLRYKSLARLLTANGWAWIDAWVRDGRYRPEYVVAGTATGRWATSGGGAMQLPAQIRAAVRADPGHRLIVADAAQLEPRIIAAMSRDEAMASAGRGRDLYRGLVEAGVVATRDQAKLAMLGALYGATSGESGALMPRLRRAFPRAIALVEEAAARGERGLQVSTWLGRGSPAPGEAWVELRRRAGSVDATEHDSRRHAQSARDWGRFTRNFIAQGTAAEWALCWMAGLRQGLDDLNRAAGLGDAEGAHLVYFLHDEVVVQAPETLAEAAAEAVRLAAERAGAMLFGSFPVDFPLSVAVVERYSDAG